MKKTTYIIIALLIVTFVLFIAFLTTVVHSRQEWKETHPQPETCALSEKDSIPHYSSRILELNDSDILIMVTRQGLNTVYDNFTTDTLTIIAPNANVML